MTTNQTSLPRTNLPLSVSTNWKATKCLKQANWTQQWFNNAYVSVDASTKLEDAFAEAYIKEKYTVVQKPTTEIAKDSSS